MNLERVKSINVLDDERILMDGNSVPDEIHLPGGTPLRPVISGGRIIGATATDGEGAPLDTLFLTLYRPMEDRLKEQLASEETDCAVCVCYADGGCQCIPIPCPGK